MMSKSLLFRARLAAAVALASSAATIASGAEVTPKPADVVQLAPFVVGESRAEAFYVRVEEGDSTRLWFASLEGSARKQASPPARPGVKSWGYLVAFRSFGVRNGDEIVSIGGKAVAGMAVRDWTRALRSGADDAAVIVEVREPGSSLIRRASIVEHNSVTLGAKVPKTR